MGNAVAERDERAVAQVHGADSIMAVIERAANNPDTDIEKMERLMQMYERMQAKQAEQSFNDALNKAQSETRRVSADATNPQTRSKYATYAALDRALRPIYSGHGFSLSFDTGEPPEAGYVRVLCYVSHASGHTRTYHVDMPADGKGAKGNDVMTKTHAAGSAMSYGMRYLLKMIFNVAVGEDDDDGNSGSGGAQPRITKDQAATLQALAEEVKADMPKFLQYLSRVGKSEIKSISDIPAKMYTDAVQALNQKRGAAK